MEYTICLVGTLDTKGNEYAYLKHCIESLGGSTLVVDCGLFPPDGLFPDIGADDVAAACGTDRSALISAGDPGAAVVAMSRGAAAVVRELYDEGRINGVISMGGGQGTTVAAAACNALPAGFPKLILSTIALVDKTPFQGISDALVMDPIVDISGSNTLLHRALHNAAAAVCGMAAASYREPENSRPCIAVSMFGITTPCGERICARLSQAGFDPLVFHGTGTGGAALETLVRSGAVRGVIDMTLTEVGQYFLGGLSGTVPDRMCAAAEAGIPQVIAPGAVDAVNYMAPAGIPEKFRATRLFYMHNATVALMRTNAEENALIGKTIAERAGKSSAPVSILLPLRGVSAYDCEGEVFHDPSADAALFAAIEQNLCGGTALKKLDLHINDTEFADALVDELLTML